MNKTALIFLIVWWVLLCLLPSIGMAQTTLSNLHQKTINAQLPWQVLDTFSIANPILSAIDTASGQTLDVSLFSLKNNKISIDTAQLARIAPNCTRLRITYRRLLFDLGRPVFRLDTTAIQKQGIGINDYIGFDYSPYEPDKTVFESAGLNTNGAYTRGLSFGNSQNLVFNSNLNLQLDGKLGNDLEIKAAISDNSVPIQPDGTTRQLQEFDRIFIQIKRKNTLLTAGDYDLVRPKGYFMQYFKRVQGASLESKIITNFSNWNKKKPLFSLPKQNLPTNRDTLYFRTAAAVSKGKFARQTIRAQEGNQGPYRLQGADGEQFIIVLAGTEKVYIDGQLLNRGIGDDYIIDYNVGELSFTTRRLITKDSRILVEFEYAVQTFLRSTLTTNSEWRSKKARVHFGYYSEQDSRSSGAAQDLSQQERRSLALAGDNLRNAFASGIDTLGANNAFDPDRIQYSLIDTVACGNRIQVLKYALNADSALYLARFSQVGQGQGNYVQVATAANGRVFRWVEPDQVTCLPKGNFEPIVRLIAPELKQMYTAGVDFRPFKGASVQTEMALSNRDFNRFSPIGNGNNVGLGGYVGFKQQLLQVKKNRGWQAQLNGNYEYAAKNFNPLNPYRIPEFTRDWNTESVTDTADENIAKAGFQLQKKEITQLRYEFGSFNKGVFYQGNRNIAQWKFNHRGYTVFAEGNILQTQGKKEKTRFSRPKIDVSKAFLRKNSINSEKPNPEITQQDSLALPDIATSNTAFTIGIYGEREKNERINLAFDTLTNRSFWYDLGRIYIKTPEDIGQFQWGMSLSRRNDYAPIQKDFLQNTVADEANINGKWQPLPTKKLTQSLLWNLTTRKLKILQADLTTEKPQNTYLGRIDHNITLLKNVITLTTGYEVGSGQSPKVEFNYVQVNPGEGTYTWIDRNRDSILQVDEMEIAVFQDQATYFRVAVTTSDFIRTNNVSLNESIRLDPRMAFGQSKKKWKKMVSRFSEQSNLLINRRVLEGAKVSAWNPFDLAIADTSLVTVASNIRNALFFNRANPVWDASLSQSANKSRIILTTGFESRSTDEWLLRTRINLNRTFTAETELNLGQKTTDVENFNNRDFNINFREISPQLTWLPSRQFRTLVKYHLQKSKNAPENGGETANQRDWSTEITWNPKSKNKSGFAAATSLRVKGTLAQISFDGQPNSVVSYAMLEGLQNGKNYLWSLNFDRQLNKNMQLSLNYEGRRTGENRLVHVGRAQVRALF
jgi:hypothetical protein